MGSSGDEKKKNKNGNSKPTTNNSNTKFTGATKEMLGHIYDYKPGLYSGTTQFENTTKQLITYCSSTFDESSSLRYSLTKLKKKMMAKPTLATSAKDTAGNAIPSEQDKLEFNEYIKSWNERSTKLDDSLQKSFAIAYGQTTLAMQGKIAESDDWPTVEENSDCIGLLKIMQKIAHNKEEQTDPTLSLIDGTARIYSLKQGNHQSIESYRVAMENQLQVIHSSGGHLYQDPFQNPPHYYLQIVGCNPAG